METEKQRLDRNFHEILQELRVAQTGVQVLFGFLLTVPFTMRFQHALEYQIIVYLITIMFCAVATAFLIAPVSHHRRAFRKGLKSELVERSNRLAKAGLLSLLLAISGAIFLIVSTAVNIYAAGILTLAILSIYIFLWYVLPIS